MKINLKASNKSREQEGKKNLLEISSIPNSSSIPSWFGLFCEGNESCQDEHCKKCRKCPQGRKVFDPSSRCLVLMSYVLASSEASLPLCVPFFLSFFISVSSSECTQNVHKMRERQLQRVRRECDGQASGPLNQTARKVALYVNNRWFFFSLLRTISTEKKSFDGSRAYGESRWGNPYVKKKRVDVYQNR